MHQWRIEKGTRKKGTAYRISSGHFGVIVLLRLDYSMRPFACPWAEKQKETMKSEHFGAPSMTVEEMDGPRRKQDDRRQKISYFA